MMVKYKEMYRLFNYKWKGWNFSCKNAIHWKRKKKKKSAEIPADCNKDWNKFSKFSHVLQMRNKHRIYFRRFLDEDRLSRTGHYLDLRSFLLLSMVFSLSPLHFGQYHLPFGLYVSPTQEKWNHSIGHWSLSQPIISPYETCSQRQ